MKNLFEAANEYCQGTTWKDMSFLKVCLIALGVLIGLSIPEGGKTAAYVVAGILFVACYIPVMPKFLKILFKK